MGGGAGLPFSDAGLEPCLVNALRLSVGDCWLMRGSSPLLGIPGRQRPVVAAAAAITAPTVPFLGLGIRGVGGLMGSLILIWAYSFRTCSTSLPLISPLAA